MSNALKQPQLFLDYLVPVGREKLRFDEAAKILSADDGEAPVSVKSIRNAMQEGRLFGNLIAFRSKVGQEQLVRHGFMTRIDVLQALLVTRTAPPEAQLAQLAEIAARLPAEAQDELMRQLVAARQRRPMAARTLL